MCPKGSQRNENCVNVLVAADVYGQRAASEDAGLVERQAPPALFTFLFGMASKNGGLAVGGRRRGWYIRQRTLLGYVYEHVDDT